MTTKAEKGAAAEALDQGPLEFLLARLPEDGTAMRKPRLVSIDSRHLVNHYNGCLIEMGIQPTKLKKFNIDGMGWSPEIAQEKNNPRYLSAGLANPMAIIVTPNQREKTVCFPFHSFDKALIRKYFNRYEGEIADITLHRGIAIDLDQELIRYDSPRDLLLVDYTIVRSSAGCLSNYATEQAALTRKLLDEEMAWFEPRLRDQIIESAKQHGDLRFRQLHIPDMKYDGFRSYYTRAFGGVFVLRNERGGRDLLAVADKKLIEAHSLGEEDTYHAEDPKLLERLIKDGFIEVDMEWCSSNADYLKHKRECMVLHAICERDENIDYPSLTSARKKQLLRSDQTKIPEAFHELERLIKRLESGGAPVKANDLSTDLRNLLLHPAIGSNLNEEAVLWRLLARFQPLDICTLYWFDRERFYKSYMQWADAKQRWATECINASPLPTV